MIQKFHVMKTDRPFPIKEISPPEPTREKFNLFHPFTTYFFKSRLVLVSFSKRLINLTSGLFCLLFYQNYKIISLGRV